MGMDFTAALVLTDLINHFDLTFASCSQIFLSTTSHFVPPVCSSNNLFSTFLIIMNNDNANDGNGAGAPAVTQNATIATYLLECFVDIHIAAASI